VAVLLTVLCAAAAACSESQSGDVHMTPAGADVAAPTAASDSRPLVFLDPGHGGDDAGSSPAYHPAGTPLEKDLTLDLARRTAARLEALGYRVVLARDADVEVNEPARDLNADGCVDEIDELQARIDDANAAGAAVLLSLHFNGMPDPRLSGTATYYNAVREFGAANERLAGLIQAAQLEALAGLGHAARDWGATRDDSFEGFGQTHCPTGYPYYTILGPAATARPRPSLMPGVIAEPLFLTHPTEAALAGRADVREALAAAYARAVQRFLEPGASPARRGG
jgi:N-acetylmuramoyl-L-alanine amidase